jgi:hypothetical protein
MLHEFAQLQIGQTSDHVRCRLSYDVWWAYDIFNLQSILLGGTPTIG